MFFKKVRNLAHIAVLSAAILSCTKEMELPTGQGSITISIEETKSLEKTEFEKGISSISYLLFKDDTLIRVQSCGEISSMTFNGLTEGTYKAAVLTGRLPEMATGVSLSELSEGNYYMYLRDNGYSDGFHMYGITEANLEKGGHQKVSVTLFHSCSRIDITGISVGYSRLLKEMGVNGIIPQKLFILEAFNSCHLFGRPVMKSDWEKNGVGSINHWNGSAMEFSDDNAERNASVCLWDDNEGFGPLYSCPTAGSDVPSSPFLVIQTLASFISGKQEIWYYRLHLDDNGHPLHPNNEYSFSLKITGPGADSPTKDAPGSISTDDFEPGEPQTDFF